MTARIVGECECAVLTFQGCCTRIGKTRVSNIPRTGVALASPQTQHRTRRCLVLEPARWIIPVILGRMEYSRMDGPLDGLIRSPMICSSCWMGKVVSSAAVTA